MRPKFNEFFLLETIQFIWFYGSQMTHQNHLMVISLIDVFHLTLMKITSHKLFDCFISLITSWMFYNWSKIRLPNFDLLFLINFFSSEGFLLFPLLKAQVYVYPSVPQTVCRKKNLLCRKRCLNATNIPNLKFLFGLGWRFSWSETSKAIFDGKNMKANW